MGNYKLNNIYDHPDIYSVSEYINDKFYFATLVPGICEPKQITNIYFFTIDDELIYNNFHSDFGPLNIGCLYKYCWKVNKILNTVANRRKQIVHYTVQHEEKKANATYLVACYAILYLKKTPKGAYRPLVEGNNHLLKPFRDASLGVSNYNIRLQDCLNALHKAVSLGFFNFDDFNLSEYDKYEKLKYGDLNWIVPLKFIAFAGPNTKPQSAYRPPEHYYNYFIKNNVMAIVRLNDKETYDSNRFMKIGIQHYDMFMPDGSDPSRKILNQFLYLAETSDRPIAVHCQAGLGRTGSLISAYLIKHYRMTAREAIAWMRICRPGSVIGHQQSWLESMQKELWLAGQQYRMKNYGNKDIVMRHKYGIYSIVQKFEMKYNMISLKDNSPRNNRKKYKDASV
ncbi:hypothetical protein PV327_003439 [Microctonus hyperodae]|uniref:protein-tyrosine-phosphatase n=1 Tax=Microctonus hyperodae TaxID=165561 RepID=A0AA39G4H4_MICHY|nr:hypothetical protein PV327_003439 [Microctonus hyperodae]